MCRGRVPGLWGIASFRGWVGRGCLGWQFRDGKSHRSGVFAFAIWTDLIAIAIFDRSCLLRWFFHFFRGHFATLGTRGHSRRLALDGCVQAGVPDMVLSDERVPPSADKRGQSWDVLDEKIGWFYPAIFPV